MRILLLVIVLVAAVLIGLSLYRAQETPEVQGIRIVSLSPAVTEILFELGLGQQIVGTSEFSDFPPQAKEITRIGGYHDPNVEQILRLKPDLVVGQRIGQDKIKQLQQKVGAACRLLLVKVDSLNEIMVATVSIAEATGKGEQGKALANSWRATIDGLKSRYGNVGRQDRLRVFVEVSGNPLQTAGPGSYISELIGLAGGHNVGDEAVGLWPVISSETVMKWNPQVILVVGMTRSDDFKKEISSRLGWEGIEAVKTRRIIELGDAYKRQGPRLFEHAEELARIIHGPVELERR